MGHLFSRSLVQACPFTNLNTTSVVGYSRITHVEVSSYVSTFLSVYITELKVYENLS